MKLKKLPSGNWNARVFDHTDETGKKIYKSFTAKNKYEVYNMIALWKEASKSDDSETIGELVDKYIEINSLLSPTTLAGYEKIRRTAFQSLMDMRVDEVDEIVLQKAINEESNRIGRRGKLSPKTVRNNYSLIASAIKKYTGKSYNVTLPDEIPKLIDYPEAYDVYAAVKGSDIELPCLLALELSFSMSEIRGLTVDSVRNGMIHVDQVKVEAGSETIVKKKAKVDTRNRKLEIPEEIMDLIKETDAWKNGEGFLVTLPSASINRKFKRLMKNIGIEDLSFHKLRHLNASVMAYLNIPDIYAKQRGGWKTDYVMKKVYQHTLSQERKAVDAQINEEFENMKRRYETEARKALKS